MSTRSGITATKELLSKFQNLKEETLAVAVSDDQTRLVEDESFVQPSNTSLKSVFGALNNHFRKNYPQPGYAIFPRPESSDYVFVAFIPDLAPIRQKMLYASTKNTLIQQMGSGSFGKKYILALTELDELSVEHFEHATRSGTDPNLLTSDERVLQDINRLQTLSVSQDSPSAFKKELPSMHGRLGGSLLFQIDAELDSILRGDMAQRLVVMNIDAKEQLVLTAQLRDVPVDALIASASLVLDAVDATPLYMMYGYGHSKIALIYLCPSGSKVRDRMVYAANKKGLIAHLRSEYFPESNFDKVLEVGDLGELDISVLEISSPEASAPPKSSLKFTKPKGPRRR